MNYEQMIQRLIDGLLVIQGHTGGSVEVAAHAYVIMVPQTDFGDYNESEREDMVEWGWRWVEEQGWILPVLG